MNKTLTWLDYAMIFITLLISSMIGLYYRFTGGRQKTTEEFFSANRDMGVTTIAIGLMVSYLSAVSLLGVSSEIYNYGTHYSVIIIGYLFATPIITNFYLPVFFKLGSTSTFQYLELRFGTTARLTACTLFLSQFLLYSGVVLYAPALALETTTGLSMTMSVIIMGIVCTFYSTIGGIKAVLVTDLFQGFLMILSVVIVIVNAAIDAGGFFEILEIADQGGRIDFTNFSVDPTTRHSWWSVTIGGFFTYLSLYGVNQVQVQRMLTVRTLKNAQKAVWLSLPITTILVISISLSGLAIYSKYKNCDPLRQQLLSSNDQLMPHYIMENLSIYPGIPGIFIAGIFCAGLSTISAVQNSVAAIILEDYIKPLFQFRGKRLDEKTSTIISKILAFSTGLICLGVAFIARHLGNLLQAALTIFGVAGGPLLGIYTLGMFFESPNEFGAVSGLLLSLAFSLWIGFGQPKPIIQKLNLETSGCCLLLLNTTQNNKIQISNHDSDDLNNNNDNYYFYLYRISYMWYCFLGFIFCLITGLIISKIKHITQKSNSKINNKINPVLFTPFIAEKIRQRQLKIPNVEN